MRIGILGAMAQEIELLQSDLEAAGEATIGMRRYVSGRLYGCDAVVVFSRYGKVAAAATATTLIETFNADLLIFTGVAGGAAEGLRIGDIVVADRLLQHDMDVRALGLGRFVVPLLDRASFPVAPGHVELACRSAEDFIQEDLDREVPPEARAAFGIGTPSVVVGAIASGDQFVADAGRIAELRQAIPDLKCVEMEGAAVAQVCFEHAVPCIVLRVVSDLADESASIDFSRFVESIASRFTRGAVRHLIRTFGEAR